MYHAIVRRNVKKLFEALGRGDIDYVVAGMAPRFEHIFPGDHTLGGVRLTCVSAIRAWGFKASVLRVSSPQFQDQAHRRERMALVVDGRGGVARLWNARGRARPT